MSKIKEVAEACGVSIATVSNVMNGNGRVSEESRNRILQMAKEMNYVPNWMAKNLKQHKSKVIGIITEDLTVFNSVDIIDGINEYLDQKQYTFVLGNLRLFKKYNNEFYHHEDYFSQVQEEFRIMESTQVAGIIYVCAHCREIKFIPKMDQIPVVITYGFSNEVKIPSVIYNDEQAAFDATTEMIINGHEKIGLIAGERLSLHTTARLKGYQRALYENELLFNPDFIYDGDWSRVKGYEAAKDLISKGVTAIFSMNDEMAAGVYDYVYESGLEIGKDISLVGFDNREISTAFRPALTTMAIPLSEIGRDAAKTMIDILEKKSTLHNSINHVDCKLVKRKSVNTRNKDIG